MPTIRNQLTFSFLTTCLMLFTHNLSALLHEWTHGACAWLFGYKSSPFNIYYGHGAWMLILNNVDESVNYKQIALLGHPYQAGIIAIMPVIMGAVLFSISLLFLHKQFIKKRPWLYFSCFWFTLMNLGQILDYIPNRTFASHADIFNFVNNFQLSPYWVYFSGMLILVCGAWYFLTEITPQMYVVMNIQKTYARAILLLFMLLWLFYWFGSSGRHASYDTTSQVFSWTSIALVPFLFIVCFPKRRWVVEKTSKLTTDPQICDSK